MILHETNEVSRRIKELKRNGQDEGAALLKLALDAAHAVRNEAVRWRGRPDPIHWAASLALTRSDHSWWDILEATKDSVKFSISLRQDSEPAIVEVALG
jgi:hypothetical protein